MGTALVGDLVVLPALLRIWEPISTHGIAEKDDMIPASCAAPFLLPCRRARSFPRRSRPLAWPRRPKRLAPRLRQLDCALEGGGGSAGARSCCQPGQAAGRAHRRSIASCRQSHEGIPPGGASGGASEGERQRASGAGTTGRHGAIQVSVSSGESVALCSETVFRQVTHRLVTDLQIDAVRGRIGRDR